MEVYLRMHSEGSTKKRKKWKSVDAWFVQSRCKEVAPDDKKSHWMLFW